MAAYYEIVNKLFCQKKEYRQKNLFVFIKNFPQNITQIWRKTNSYIDRNMRERYLNQIYY